MCLTSGAVVMKIQLAGEKPRRVFIYTELLETPPEKSCFHTSKAIVLVTWWRFREACLRHADRSEIQLYIYVWHEVSSLFDRYPAWYVFCTWLTETYADVSAFSNQDSDGIVSISKTLWISARTLNLSLYLSVPYTPNVLQGVFFFFFKQY